MQKETELFEPVAHYLLSEGYDVRAEVNDCDVVGIKDTSIIIIELKLKFNIELLIQASDRLRYTDQVYVAVPAKEINLFKKKGKKQRHLLRTLEIGLLTVSKDDEGYVVKKVLEAKPMNKDLLRKRNKKKLNRLIEEFHGREKLSNIGGITRMAIHTAYKELNIKVATQLIEGPKSIREIKEVIPNKKVASVLQKNYYGWYERIDRGVYQLTKKGTTDINDIL